MHDETSPPTVIPADHDLTDFHQRATQHTTRKRSRWQTYASGLTRGWRTAQTSGSRLPRRYILHSIVLGILLITLIIGRVRITPQPRMDAEPAAVISASIPRPFARVAGVGPQQQPAALPQDLPLSPDWRLPDVAISTRNEVPTLHADADHAPTTVPGMQTLVRAEKANVRTGPGTQYDIVGVIPNDTTITIQASYAEWLQVDTPVGSGWIAADLVARDGVDETAIPVATTIPEPPPPLVAETTSDNLNLRDGPSTEYIGMTKLPAGTRLDILVQYEGWYRVQTTDGAIGWVTGEYLTMQPGVAERVPQTTTIPPVNPALLGTATDTGVNVRSGPSKQYPSLGTVKAGAELTLLARYDIWLQVETAQGTAGWIASDFVNVSPFILRRVPTAKSIPALPTPKLAAKPATKPTAPQPVAPKPAAPAPLPIQPAADAGSVVAFAMQFQGYPYVWGADGPDSFDCSGFTQYVYAQFGLSLPHSAAGQYNARYGTFIGSRESLAPGDLVFFANTYKPGISHVGIYIGDGKVIQAMSPELGVGIAGVYGPYWGERYYGGLRPNR